MALTLTVDERAELERRLRSLKIRAEDARGARDPDAGRRSLVLDDRGHGVTATRSTGGAAVFWRSGSRGLRPRYRRQPPTVLTPAMEAWILEKIRHAASDGRTQWSTPKLGRLLKIHHNLVGKAWRPGCSPIGSSGTCNRTTPISRPRRRRDRPLYRNPPDHAAVLAVDEKTAIQALDRLDPVLPLSPGRAERHGFEYYRHGTLSLLAALDTKSGEVLAHTVPRHTSAAFVEFLGDIVTSQPTGREIHVIADNLSTHKNPGGPHIFAGAPDRAPPLHADLFVVAQPS